MRAAVTLNHYNYNYQYNYQFYWVLLFMEVFDHDVTYENLSKGCMILKSALCCFKALMVTD